MIISIYYDEFGRPFTDVEILGKKCKFLIDTGSTFSYIPKKIADSFSCNNFKVNEMSLFIITAY